jgi:hypothetical protein
MSEERAEYKTSRKIDTNVVDILVKNIEIAEQLIIAGADVELFKVSRKYQLELLDLLEKKLDNL